MYLKPKQIHLHLGLEKPIRILHLTDLHLSLSDDQDNEEQKEWAPKRREVFFREAKAPQRDPIGYFEEAMEYSKQFDYTVITGDILDGLGHANREEARRILGDHEYLYCLGNHEFCTQVHDAKIDQREAIREDLKTVFRGNLVLESRIVGGVNLIAADNSWYSWTEEQFELLKKEVAKGYPILIFTHSPLENGTRTLNPEYSRRMESIRNLIIRNEGESAVITTCKVVEYIATEPLIKATFAGHFHADFEEPLGEKTTYILGGLFKGIVGEILID